MLLAYYKSSDMWRDANFCSHLLELVVPILVNQQTSTNLFHSLTTGLELLVVNFSLTVQERTKIATTAASRYIHYCCIVQLHHNYHSNNLFYRFLRSDQTKSLAALSLLVACMYTGMFIQGTNGSYKRCPVLCIVDCTGLAGELHCKAACDKIMQICRLKKFMIHALFWPALHSHNSYKMKYLPHP